MIAKKHFIVQMGSGQPGESRTEETEYKVFHRMGLKDPKILFCPLHHLQHGASNDWTNFTQLIQPFTRRPIELVEFHREPDPVRLEEKILSADVVVLGSGVCEPFLEHFYRHRLDRAFRRFFSKGGSFVGYSAGSITLSDCHILTLFYRELFQQYNSLLKYIPGDEFYHFSQSILYEAPDEHRDYLENLFQQRQPIHIPTHPLSNQVYMVLRLPALGFIPNLSVLPHFLEAPHSTFNHLLVAARRYPRHRHFGIPNGCALFHTFRGGIHYMTEAVGANRNPAYMISQVCPKHSVTFSEGEVLNLDL